MDTSTHTGTVTGPGAEVRAGTPVPTDSEIASYATQTRFSDPGRFAALLDDLPDDVPGLAAAVRGLVVHYVGSGLDFPPGRRADIDARWVAAILGRIVDRDPAPLTTARAVGERFVGCCRDFSLLTVAALRHRGVPARTRVGFAPYLDATFCHDHVVVEYWEPARGWVRTDPQLAPAWQPPRPAVADDLGTGPDSPFRPAALVWREHREGRLEGGADGYGAAPDGPLRGEWFLGNYVLGELAHLTGHELLLWDLWGAMSMGPFTPDPALVPPHLVAERGEQDLALVDRVADALLDPAATLDGLGALSADPRLDPRTGVLMVSPTGAQARVNVAASASQN